MNGGKKVGGARRGCLGILATVIVLAAIIAVAVADSVGDFVATYLIFTSFGLALGGLGFAVFGTSRVAGKLGGKTRNWLTKGE